MPEKTLVIITGMSGAGKTLATHVFEDLEFCCIDNLPPAIIQMAAREWMKASANCNGLAFVIDGRAGESIQELASIYDSLQRNPLPGFGKPRILFLEAGDEILVRRFKETRRRHPLVSEQRGILESIKYERELLTPIKQRADKIIDTTKLEPLALRKTIETAFSAKSRAESLLITVVSFGFKHGIPLDADVVFDVRFLANPHYIAELKPYTGNEEPVRQFVVSDPLTEPLLEKLFDLVEFTIPQYAKEGKAYLTIAIGCTGGRHRSVVLANELARFLAGRNYTVVTEHRDVGTPAG